jgi:hypothetical protein
MAFQQFALASGISFLALRTATLATFFDQLHQTFADAYTEISLPLVSCFLGFASHGADAE